jgi:hypothetical protein
MGEQTGKGTGQDLPTTDLTPKKKPYYEGYFGDDEGGAGREADDGSEGAASREEPGGHGEGAL